jgi:hypothetical protein
MEALEEPTTEEMNMATAEQQIRHAAVASWLALTAPGFLFAQATLALVLVLTPWLTAFVYVAPSVQVVAAALLLVHCVSAVAMTANPRHWPLTVVAFMLLVLDAVLCGFLIAGSAHPRGAAAPVAIVALVVSLGAGGWLAALVSMMGTVVGVAVGAWMHIAAPLLACPALSFSTRLSIETSYAGVPATVPTVSFPSTLSIETLLAGVPFEASTTPLFMPALTIALAAVCVGLGVNLVRVGKAKAGVMELIVAAGRLAA